MATPTQKRLIQKRLTDLRRSRRFKWTGFSGKTLWDWLATLLIPIVVVGATIGFGWWQAHLTDVQHKQDQTNALDQQQAAILQTYIDNIQDLLLNHKLGDAPSLIPIGPNTYKVDPHTTEIQELARARTLTALQGLDPKRKGVLLSFLYEAHLIGYNINRVSKADPIIDLSKADLSGTDFQDSPAGANLAFTNLSDAHLSYISLFSTDLTGANFSGADFSGTLLWGSDLSDARNLTQQQLDQVITCYGATLPKGLTCHRNCIPDQPDPTCVQELEQLQ